MLNLIKADLYRILRHKGVYITLVIFLSLLMIHNIRLEKEIMFIDVISMQSDAEYTLIEKNGETTVATPEFTGKTAVFAHATITDGLILFILPFIVFIIAADFSHNTVKNTLSGGTARIKYFISKTVLTAGACLFIWLINLIAPIIMATVRNGFGGDFNGVFVSDVLKIYLPQLYLLFAYASIGIFLVFTFKRTAVLNTVYIAFLILPAVFLDIVSAYKMARGWIKYDLMFNIKSFAYPTDTIPPDLTRTLILGGVYILVCIVGGIMLFRRSEIK